MSANQALAEEVGRGEGQLVHHRVAMGDAMLGAAGLLERQPRGLVLGRQRGDVAALDVHGVSLDDRRPRQVGLGVLDQVVEAEVLVLPRVRQFVHEDGTLLEGELARAPLAAHDDAPPAGLVERRHAGLDELCPSRLAVEVRADPTEGTIDRRVVLGVLVAERDHVDAELVDEVSVGEERDGDRTLERAAPLLLDEAGERLDPLVPCRCGALDGGGRSVVARRASGGGVGARRASGGVVTVAGGHPHAHGTACDGDRQEAGEEGVERRPAQRLRLRAGTALDAAAGGRTGERTGRRRDGRWQRSGGGRRPRSARQGRRRKRHGVSLARGRPNETEPFDPDPSARHPKKTSSEEAGVRGVIRRSTVIRRTLRRRGTWSCRRCASARRPSTVVPSAMRWSL